MKNIKFQLQELYLSKWDQFSAVMKNDPEFANRSHPHLISLTDSFEKDWNEAELRIMLTGISTNGWGQKNYAIYTGPSELAVASLMDQYEEFYFKGGNWHYAQVFWNYVYALQELLGYRLNKKVRLIWNNVHKTDPRKQNVEQELFSVLHGEVSILQPDVILLFGLDTRNVLHTRLSEKQIDWSEYESWSDHYTDKPFLFYNVPGQLYSSASNRLKNVIVTYHPNARGDAGIKMKLLLDELTSLLS